MKLLAKKVIKASVCLTLIFAMIICSGNFTKDTAYGYDEKPGVIVGNADNTLARAYAAPSANGNPLRKFNAGKVVTVIGETIGDDGQLWYQIRYNLASSGAEETSYCRAMNVSVNGADPVKPNVSYEPDAVVVATGTVTATNVYVRNGAGTEGTYLLTALNAGHQVDVIGQTIVGNAIWYKVNCSNGGVNYTGWIAGSYLQVVPLDIQTDADFEQTLRDAGFPESYIRQLSILHTQYPNWSFVPVHTNLDWNSVIAAESAAAVNMVQTTADDAKKSVSASEYNWLTNTWTIRDGSGWVTAHPDYIAYCMDPRNYLNGTSIFQFESLSYSQNHNKVGVEAILKGSFMETVALEPDNSQLNYADAFMSIGATANVSPYHLASRVLQEQGGGTSPLISGTYLGYENLFNYFNIGAFGTPESVLYKNGLNYAKNQGWTTRYASLLGGANFLAEKYISKGQDTLYFQKFNVVYSEKLFAHQYMANVTAAITEGQKIAQAYADKSQSFVFEIPVYLNMPENPVSFTASGNRNNYLQSFSVSGLSLTPAFSAEQTDYTLIVDSSITTIKVDAVPVFEKATVTGTGNYNLLSGENIIKVYCKSQSGDTRTYNLNVVKLEDTPSVPDVPTTPDTPSTPDTPTTPDTPSTPDTPTTPDTPSTPDTPTTPDTPSTPDTNIQLTSGTYVIGDFITGIAVGTTVDSFKQNISCGDALLKVLDKNGAEATGNIATGQKVSVYKDGALVSTKDIVVYGDINGDGQVNVLDIIKLNRGILGLDQITGAYLQAGDANRKGDGVNILDLIVVNRHTLGLTTIQQ